MKRIVAVAALAMLPAVARAQGTPPAAEHQCPETPHNPTAKVMMKIAECNAAAGRVATAWRQFRQTANLAGRDLRTQHAAQNRAAAITAQLPRLTLSVPSDASLTVTIDGTEVPPEEWGAALAIDPGPHVIQSTADDGSTWQTTVQIAIRESRTIDVQKPAPKPVEPVKEPTTEPTTEPTKEPVKEPAKAPAVTLEALDPVAYDHSRAPKYSAVRTDKPPEIDGVLDDEIWKKAPKDSTFYLETSKPFGLPTDEPTTVQVAYDSRNLYVAITCSYSTPHEPSDTPPLNETDLREYVAIYLDAQHDHSSEHVFALSPDGYRSDWEVWNNGQDSNFEWTGLWEGQTAKNPKGWTAEFEIPWGTVAMKASPRPRMIGINFRRSIAAVSEMSWSLSPPGSPRPLPSFAGHLAGIVGTDLTQILTLVPYVALGWANQVAYRDPPRSSWLRNANGAAKPFSTYAGLYGRLQLSHGLGADFMINPDFSQVTPDAALSNLDRFELFFPEVRPFFVNLASTYAFGSDRYQLFYSRRIGLRHRLYGFEEVPILFGGNAQYREGGTTLSVLEVYNDGLDGPTELGRPTKIDPTHTLVARAIQEFGPSRIGFIAIDQTEPYGTTGYNGLSGYRAAGMDGVLALYQNHLVLSGWAAGASRADLLQGLQGPIVPGHEVFYRTADIAWQGNASFRAQELEIDGSYTDVGPYFPANLGFFERTGVHRSDLAGYYRPLIHSDLIRSVTVGLQFSQLVDQSVPGEDVPIFSRFNTLVQARLLDAGSLSFQVSQNDDTVQEAFFVANRRFGITAGSYSGKVASVSFQSAPGRDYQFGLSYVDGYYFGGDQRLVSPSLTVHLEHFAGTLLYQHYQLDGGPTSLVGDNGIVDGDRLSARLLYAYSPDVRVSGAIEANTLDPDAATQLVASWRIDGLSSLTFVFNHSAPSVSAWVHEPYDQVLLKFDYGITAP